MSAIVGAKCILLKIRGCHGTPGTHANTPSGASYNSENTVYTKNITDLHETLTAVSSKSCMAICKYIIQIWCVRTNIFTLIHFFIFLQHGLKYQLLWWLKHSLIRLQMCRFRVLQYVHKASIQIGGVLQPRFQTIFQENVQRKGK